MKIFNIWTNLLSISVSESGFSVFDLFFELFNSVISVRKSATKKLYKKSHSVPKDQPRNIYSPFGMLQRLLLMACSALM